MRSSRRSQGSSRQAERMMAVLAGLLCTWLVTAFLRPVAGIVLLAAATLFALLLWRGRGSHTDVTIRVGLGTFMAALAFVLVRRHLNLG
jgi:hypothetical protein